MAPEAFGEALASGKVRCEPLARQAHSAKHAQQRQAQHAAPQQVLADGGANPWVVPPPEASPQHGARRAALASRERRQKAARPARQRCAIDELEEEEEEEEEPVVPDLEPEESALGCVF